MLRFVYFVGASLLIAPPVAGQTTSAEARPIQSVSSPDSSAANRIVCRKEETVGSRLAAKKVCLTVKEWQERAAADRDETSRVQRLARVPNGG